MKKGFEDMLAGQKKMFELWQEWTQNAMEASPFGKKAEPETDFLKQWLDQQQKLYQDALKMGNLKDAFDKTPEQMTRWMKLQNEMAEKWMDFYRENAGKVGMKVPPMNGFAKTGFPGYDAGQWTKMMEESSEWIKKNILDRLPFPMQPHFETFSSLYEDLFQYWQPFQKLIQFGLYDPEAVKQYLDLDAYKEIIGKFMGFKPVHNYSELVTEANEFFENYIDLLKNYRPNSDEFTNRWNQLAREWGRGQWNPTFEAIFEVSEMIQKGTDSLYMVAGQNREVEIARLLKDIHFEYVAFLVKSAELQSRIWQAGQFALPDTIKSMYRDFRETKKMPEYKEFFGRFVNQLEDYMLEVLESKDYSLLQSEVSKLGITVKSRLDQMIELAFANFPFLMKSHADEVARENASLRKKIRSLEERLLNLEERFAATPSVTAMPSGGKNDAQSTLLSAIGAAARENRDDLKLIKGIGPKLEEMLNAIGIYTFEQISHMTQREYDLVDQLLSAFHGRASRDGWAQQAAKLLKGAKVN